MIMVLEEDDHLPLTRITPGGGVYNSFLQMIFVFTK